jgi:UDP-N-acetylglucosamine--N-acetylmuramyl-(pentapeptide) pyrophosphoryl-undecaprenol N-acetylglucosamine transferase
MRILVSGGKTGGHLIPGIALFEEFVRRGHDCRYMMAATDLRFPVAARVPENSRYLVELSGISRRLSWRTPFFLLKILGAFSRVFGQVREIKPDAVVITGGYISNPVALSAILSGVPLYIAEQNSVAGVTNRFYAKFARKIFTNFPDTRRIPPSKAVVTGSPGLFHSIVEREYSRRFFGLEAFGRVVGVTGGSQGAKKLNNAVLSVLPALRERGIGVVWSAGSVDYDRMEREGILADIRKRFDHVQVFQFIERMDLFYSACDAVVSRAGASVFSEFVHFGIPSVLVPIEHSPDDHQLLNAKFLSEHGAALLLEERDMSPETLLSAVQSSIDENARLREGVLALRDKYFQSPSAARIAAFIEADRSAESGAKS